MATPIFLPSISFKKIAIAKSRVNLRWNIFIRSCPGHCLDWWLLENCGCCCKGLVFKCCSEASSSPWRLWIHECSSQVEGLPRGNSGDKIADSYLAICRPCQLAYCERLHWLAEMSYRVSMKVFKCFFRFTGSSSFIDNRRSLNNKMTERFSIIKVITWPTYR